jgi:hypothetical protein
MRRDALDQRLFFVVGDFLANILVGSIVGLVCWAIVSPSWNMWIAMFAMMPVGTVVGLILFFPIGIKLGAMEVMVPLMFSGELSGMVVGMGAAMAVLTPGQAALLGAASGAASIFFVWAANTLLRGVVSREVRER